MSRIAHGFPPAAGDCNPELARFIKPEFVKSRAQAISRAVRSRQDDLLALAVENQPFQHANGRS